MLITILWVVVNAGGYLVSGVVSSWLVTGGFVDKGEGGLFCGQRGAVKAFVVLWVCGI